MSPVAKAYVEKYSSHTGSTYFVHYRLAELANPEHDFELWLRIRPFARRIRLGEKTVRRAMAALVENGDLVELEQRPGKSTRYRFPIENTLRPALEDDELGPRGAIADAHEF